MINHRPLELLTIPLFLQYLTINEVLTGISAISVTAYTLHQYYDYLKNK